MYFFMKLTAHCAAFLTATPCMEVHHLPWNMVIEQVKGKNEATAYNKDRMLVMIYFIFCRRVYQMYEQVR